MLTENDVVDAVCKYLVKDGFTIEQRCSTTQRGIGIIARHQRRKEHLRIEAKGETSARTGTARFGKEFSNSQHRDHVAKCFYTAVSLQNKFGDLGDTVALAFPDNPRIKIYLTQIASTLTKSGLTVYLVKHDLSVTTL